MALLLSRRDILGGLAVTATGTLAASAQDYPTRYIRVIVGPGPDVVARLFGPKLAEALGQEIVVEPRPGAGGIIASQTVAAAPPDGYMLLMATASYTIGTALRTMPQDLRKDFKPVALGTTSPFLLLVHPSLPVQNVRELVAFAKANPGKLNYASSGIGTPPHLAGELFASMTETDIVHVPFREANAALNALVSGAVQMTFSITGIAKAQAEAGSVRSLGVSTLDTSALVPDMAPIAQSGVPGFEVLGWNGFVAPPGTPDAILAKLNAAFQTAARDESLRKRFLDVGYEAAQPNSAREFAAFIANDAQKWGALVERANIQIKN